MRLIKLSKAIFDTIEDIHNYFTHPDSQFRNRNANCGIFIFPRGWIAENGIDPDETVMFSYDGNVVCITKTLSERLPWDGPESFDYPYCLQIDLSNLKMVSFPIRDLELRLTETAGLAKSLRAQGWPRLPDCDKTKTAIIQLISSSNNLQITF